MVVSLAAPTAARGLFTETALWYQPAHVDTQLTLTLGVSHLRAPAEATRFFVGLATLRRGPLEFAGSLSYEFVRVPTGAHEGPGDPRVDARLRLFSDSTSVHVYWEGSARLPTASADLFPYASGSQEVETGAVLVLQRLMNWHLAYTYIFAAPPSDSNFRNSDFPDAAHGWSSVSMQRGAWVATARVDALFFDIGNHNAGITRFGLWRRDPEGFTIGLEWAVGVGSRENRVFDHGPTLRFATPLR